MSEYSAIQLNAFNAEAPLAGTQLVKHAAPRDPAPGEVQVGHMHVVGRQNF